MTELPPHTLLNAASRLLTEIGTLVDKDDTLQLQRLEHCARALCTQLKAIQELGAHNIRQTQIETDQKYTPYEDLPPPSPAEQDRFYARLESAVTEIETGAEIYPAASSSKRQH